MNTNIPTTSRIMALVKMATTTTLDKKAMDRGSRMAVTTTMVGIGITTMTTTTTTACGSDYHMTKRVVGILAGEVGYQGRDHGKEIEEHGRWRGGMDLWFGCPFFVHLHAYGLELFGSTNEEHRVLGSLSFLFAR